MAVTWEKLAYESDVVTKGLFAAKGDLLGASADDTPDILSVGTNGHVLTADSGETLGIKWAANVLTTTAKARAYKAAPQTNIPNDDWTKVELDTESFDPGSNFDNVTNHRFTAPVAGYYMVVAHVGFGDVVADKRYFVGIFVNESNIAQVAYHASFTGSVYGLGADTVYLGQNDFVELWGLQASGGALVDFIVSANYTYLSVHLFSAD